MKILNNIYLKNIFWNFLNQFGKSGFQIVVTLILARLLTPDDFGTIAMVTIITQFAELVIDSGFLLGIVQIKDITQKELSSVFFLNLGIGISCTLIIYLIAPWIAEIYHNADLINVARVLSISCIFTASAVVQHGLMIREMNYRNRTIAQLISQLISGIIAIWLANKGFGVMALVYYSLIQSFLSALLYWLQSKWRPQLYFAFNDLRRIWAFSSNILGVTLLGNIAGRTDLFLTGKFFTPKVLGFYSKGKDFAMLPATIGGEIVALSLFPILSRLEGDEFNKSFYKTLKILMFISTILFSLLCINAKEITLILLGKGWEEADIIFRLYFCVAFFYMINTFFTFVINATGKSRTNLRKELLQAPVRIVMLIVIYYIIKPVNTLPFIYFWIVYYIVSNVYSQFLISKICNINFWDTLVGYQYIVFAIIAGGSTFFLIDFHSDILNILTRSGAFILLFSIVLFLVKDNIIGLIKNYIRKYRV
ncbi:lipopolysaccharide biosynthesis protein [Elizabethkingia meningoseptica]|uniref:lipopolysaccharide biosynthesis protein n=1 Tax=Elizabethkingia meningoseptica TaxID=238 RepID=UPI0023B1B49A|nr:lipopolysaccharide biosynthesis protein [Elizabethkingia meningoseptica]MDE5438577.1 lipopolysaccharide biosynthesis protein [Elizabethkingia meningoseptica]MDE5507648.1 lipopolysaccharide biosynthesis protein [Elizabethkingia meningoseptica]MDE5516502.1 lipopolysaccharide biosynthesis protein [Elizabethkingia meningoseptica]MDE5526747.1 lipopolysaccharide biosynthesis protein [Elizabethkingia meningoseptica]MDE5530753.1 lipopolysaccharide biosynthesis protein [Elizabethkingia meningoseptic